MAKTTYTMRSEIWLYPGMTGWHFLNVDKKQSAEIREKYPKKSHGFGSIPVVATIGKTSWKTSIFPDKQSGTYLLPLKADVRKAEGLEAGDNRTFTLEI